METILKFFENTNYKGNQGSNENDVISRTMLKIAVVSRHYRSTHADDPDKLPKHGELWRCRIVKEIDSGKNRGCFICEPISKIDEDSIIRLIPGWYDTKVTNGRLIVIPRMQGKNWIMPLIHKRIMSEEAEAYCCMVLLDEIPLKDTPEGAPFPVEEESDD